MRARGIVANGVRFAPQICTLRTNYFQMLGQKVFTTSKVPLRISFLFCKGGIAQLGERLHGMQEVSGSIPLTSTTEQK
ncbi:MAG: hypothetical protein JWR14_5106 [Caballeronia sp.]|nr:hypothetical protein [Caballeronia sp.]